MGDSIPIRVSGWLAETARKAAYLQERSLTEQVEHWARLGQVVESAILNSTATRLKSLSHDPALSEALKFADTPAGRKKAARSIAEKNPVRYGTTVSLPSKIVRVSSRHR